MQLINKNRNSLKSAEIINVNLFHTWKFVDFKFSKKLMDMGLKTSTEYATWTANIRAASYGTATAVTVGMIIADVFGCLGKQNF